MTFKKLFMLSAIVLSSTAFAGGIDDGESDIDIPFKIIIKSWFWW